MRTYDGKPDWFFFWFVVGFSLFWGLIIGSGKGLGGIIVATLGCFVVFAVMAGIAGND